MLHRLFAMLIVGFWLAMTGLLVVRELYPEASRLNEVPNGYVANLLFQHNQVSELQIYDAGKDIGYIHLQPNVSPDKQTRSIGYHGNITINPVGAGRQQLSWIGNAHFTSTNDLKLFRLMVSSEGGSNQLEIILDMVRKTADLEVRAGQRTVEKKVIPLDANGLTQLVQWTGVGALVAQSQQAIGAAPAIANEIRFSSHQSSTKLNGESVSTYLVTMTMGGQKLFEAHVSQLGQVLRAATPLFDYKLAPYKVKP
jgi:hypothetical protein